jgi:hypothetical protein
VERLDNFHGIKEELISLSYTFKTKADVICGTFDVF